MNYNASSDDDVFVFRGNSWESNSMSFDPSYTDSVNNFTYTALALSIFMLIHSFIINRGFKKINHVRICSDICQICTIVIIAISLGCASMNPPHYICEHPAVAYNIGIMTLTSGVTQAVDNFITYDRYRVLNHKVNNWLKYLALFWVVVMLFLTWVPFFTFLPFFIDMNDTNNADMYTIIGNYLWWASYFAYNYFFAFMIARRLYIHVYVYTEHDHNQPRSEPLIIWGVKAFIHALLSCVGNAFNAGFFDQSSGAIACNLLTSMTIHFLFNYKIENCIASTRPMSERLTKIRSFKNAFHDVHDTRLPDTSP